jgi:hypothetical protein
MSTLMNRTCRSLASHLRGIYSVGTGASIPKNQDLIEKAIPIFKNKNY